MKAIDAIEISPRTKIILLSVAGTLLLYTLLGFLVLPAVLSNQIPKLTQEKLNRASQIRDIQFNPFTMEMNFLGLEFKNRDDSTFISFDGFYANVAVWRSIFSLSVTLDELLLTQPFVSVKRNKKADFNFTDLLGDEQPEPKEEPENEDIFPLTIAQITIKEGKLSWEDDFYSKFQKEDIEPLNLDIKNFTTIKDKNSELGFSLNLASGGQFSWQGELTLNPFASKGKIKLDQVNFNRVWELFLQDEVNFELLSGSELISADYQLFEENQEIQLLIDNAQVAINDFQLSEKGSKDALMAVPDFKITGIAVNLLKKNVEIAEISANDAHFKAWLNAEGNINYQALFASKTENQQTAPQNQAGRDSDDDPWHVKIKQIAMKGFGLDFKDKSLKKTAHITISSLDLEMQDISTDPEAELPFKLGLKINDSGVLKLQGKAILEPFSSKIQLDAKQIAIKNFQPYIDEFLRLDVISGAVNVATDITMQQPENKPLALRLRGKSSITDLVTRDTIANKNFLKWKQLSLNDMDIDLEANRYTIDTIKVEQLYSRVLIRKDKTMNVNDIVIQPQEQEKASETQEPVDKKEANKDEAELYYNIASIEIIDSVSDFSDLSLILPFSAHINQLKGSIKGISSEPKAVAKVVLNGKVHDLAPVDIKGKFSLYKGDSDLALNFKNMPLPLMTPYMAEFAGRKIEKGKMSLGLNYDLKNKKLTASNNLLIDQLTLGAEVENPDAVSLPLDLAIAILEDSDGKIKLDVPITGSLEDPEFSVGSIVFDALVNVLTKIITSPFRALGSLIDGDEDPSQIIFLAGKSTLSEEQLVKLDGLAKALETRPKLKLEIKGTAFTKYDWPKLQAEALDKKILKLKVAELNQDSDKKVLAEDITLSDEDYQELLADLYIEKYPKLAERSLFGTPKLLDEKAGDFYKVAKKKLAGDIPPDPQRLHKFAIARSQTIAKHIIDKGVAMERVFLLDVEVDPEEATDDVIATVLNLAVN